jgi:hypothetical protein
MYDADQPLSSQVLDLLCEDQKNKRKTKED